MYVQLCDIQNPVFFRTWGSFKILSNMEDVHAYLEPWPSQKCSFTRFQGYFGICRDTDGNSATLSCVEPGRKGETSPALFENRKRCPDFGKKGADYEVPLSKGPSSTTQPPPPLPPRFLAFCKTLHLKCLTVFIFNNLFFFQLYAGIVNHIHHY